MSMMYWNSANFQGLREVGETYLRKPNYEAFANYCFLKEKGIKKAALGAMNEFISAAQEKPLKSQREIAVELASLGFENPHIHQLIPHPLQQYLITILKAWSTEENASAIPARWLGCMSGDLAEFERALEIDPTDAISLTMLVKAKLNTVDYQTHHLAEAQFIGEVEEGKVCLEEAALLIARLPSEAGKTNLLEELHTYRKLIAAWEEYTLACPDKSFPDWCKEKGENFAFWSIIYYDK
ncbi:MAG: hypothetical protein JST84_18805 [Acidobacteria bacterium]|nr:hypothetical protein [Acidobacteriota bacterium]